MIRSSICCFSHLWSIVCHCPSVFRGKTHTEAHTLMDFHFKPKEHHTPSPTLQRNLYFQVTASSPVRSHLSPNHHVCSLKIEQPRLLTVPEYVQSTFSAMERSDEFGLVTWTEFVSSSVNISQLHYSCCLVQRLWSAYSLVSYYKSSTDWSHRLLEFLALQVLKEHLKAI